MPFETFRSSPSGSTIHLNTDSRKILILDESVDLTSVISEYERIRITEFWSTQLLRKSDQGSWIEALNNTRSNGAPAQSYISATKLKEAIGLSLTGQSLTRELRSRSLEAQRDLIEAIKPIDRKGLAGTLLDSRLALRPDLHEMLSVSGSNENFLVLLANSIRENSAPIYHADRYMEFLVLLWGKGIIAFPRDIRDWTTKAKWDRMKNAVYGGSKSKMLDETKKAWTIGTHKTFGNACIYTFYATTNVATPNDISLEIIDSYETLCLTDVGEPKSNSQSDKQACHSARSEVTRVAQTLRVYFNANNPDHAAAVARTKKSTKAAELVRGDGSFNWLAAAHPHLSEWSTLFREHVGQLRTVRTDGQIHRLNNFADYLISLEAPPRSPKNIQRHCHINDPTRRSSNGYVDYLRVQDVKNTFKNACLTTVKSFFEWLHDWSEANGDNCYAQFKNPILDSDYFNAAREYKGQTARNALPSYVINEMKSVITDGDFAFPRQSKTSRVKVVDSFDGQTKTVWCPAIAICLYLMLDTPLRSHQARWLDSGELDEFTYDALSNTYVTNPSPHAIAGRRQGALQLQKDSMRSKAWLGLWVNTNKTAIYDSSQHGYLIPYLSDEMRQLLLKMRDWQRQFLPAIDKPVAYYGHKESIQERDRLAGKGPQVAPLFWDPASQHKHSPINYSRLASFYTSVLLETQKRIKAKHGQDINLVTSNEKGETQWAVDLHTLRVSGITAMIESGVPLEVVSQFVAGHSTLVMTLHYLKYSPTKLRDFLAEAHAKMLADTDFVESELFQQNLEQFAPFMLGQQGAGMGPGFSAIQNKTGIFTINADGICPGTSCSTGGPVDSSKVQHGPVPGGRRCGLCRYWITGPAHLLGQIAAVNNLAFAIRKKGQEVATLNDDRLTAEDAGNQRKARDIRNKVELLNLELAVDVEEWAARYKYANQSMDLLSTYLETRGQISAGASPSMPMLTPASESELTVTLESAHEFVLLDQITKLGQFHTGFRNREAELEKNEIISRMMAANGLDPFLLTLNEAQARDAGDLLSTLILQQVKGQELDDVLHGRLALADKPVLARSIEVVSIEARSQKLTGQSAWQASQLALTAPPGPNEHDDNEKEFG